MKRYVSKFKEDTIFYTDIFNKSNVDLKELYIKYNKQLFNSKLPPNIDLKWTVDKYTGGKVISIGLKHDPSTWKVKELQISTLTERTYGEFLGVFIHELIHVFLISQGLGENINSGHGPLFKKELKKLNSYNLGFIIPEVEDVTYRQISSDIKGKKVIVFIAWKDNKQDGIRVYTLNALNDIIKSFTNFPLRWWEITQNSYSLYYSEDPELNKYPISYKVGTGKKSVMTYTVSDSFVNRIIKNGKHIRDININDVVNR